MAPVRDEQATVRRDGGAAPVIAPNPDDARLTDSVAGIDHTGVRRTVRVVVERPLTIFLNEREIVTSMTVGDYPEYLALGFLRNQGLLPDIDAVTGVDVDDELGVAVVRTSGATPPEERLARRVRTSGCALGTLFGDVMDEFERVRLPDATVRTSWLHTLTRTINTLPSLYLSAGAIHGTVLCEADRALVYMEDVGRHNAVDKVAGYMAHRRVGGADKLIYTTGRLTSEMVIKTAMMGVPILASRSGFTAWGVSLARQVGLTLIGRLRGERFLCLAGEERLVYDAVAGSGPADEPGRHRRAAREDADG